VFNVPIPAPVIMTGYTGSTGPRFSGSLPHRVRSLPARVRPHPEAVTVPGPHYSWGSPLPPAST